MSVDTRQKRFSMMTLAMRPLQGPSMPMFEADGSVDADDRAHLLGLYSGIALAVLTVSHVSTNYLLRAPPTGDPWLMELALILNAELMEREPQIIGSRHDGTNLHLRVKTSINVSWLQIHIQSTESGKGGPTYDASNYVSSTLTDCRASRVVDVSVPDLPAGRYVIWAIPVDYNTSGTKILFDGVSADDKMAFADIGV